MVKLEEMRLERTRSGIYAVKFARGNRYCSADVMSAGPKTGKRPTGQEVLNAMRGYIKAGETDTESVLAMPIGD